jgi:hypothetical protein
MEAAPVEGKVDEVAAVAAGEEADKDGRAVKHFAEAEGPRQKQLSNDAAI